MSRGTKGDMNTHIALLGRLNKSLLALSLQGSGATVDYTSGGLGTRVSSSASSTHAPRSFGSEYQEWLERVERLTIAIERELEAGRPLRREKTSGQLTAVIREYEGRRPEFVAFVENCSADLVRRVRRGVGLDPATGSQNLGPHTSRDMPEVYAAGSA